MNIEIQNFKSPKKGLAFIYIYMKILEYPSPPLGTNCALSDYKYPTPLMNIPQPTLYRPLFQAHFQPFPRHIAAGFWTTYTVRRSVKL